MDPKLASVLVSEKMSWATVAERCPSESAEYESTRLGIACRHRANCMGPLESVVDRGRGYEERHADLKESRV